MDVSSSVFSFALDWSNSMHTIISTHNPKEISFPNRFFPDTSLWQPVDSLSNSLHSLSDILFHLHNFFFFPTSYRLLQTATDCHTQPTRARSTQQPTNTNKPQTTKYVNHVHIILFHICHHHQQLNLQPHRHPNISYPCVGFSNHISTRHHSPPSVQKAQARWCRHDHLHRQSRRCPGRT